MTKQPTPPVTAYHASANLAYVIQATDESGWVKVGYSADPARRFIGIRGSVPFGVRLICVILDGHRAEREMKALLAPWRVRGEWFQPRPELNAFLAAERGQQRIVEKVPVDQAYADAFITPAVMQHLGGREPLNNYAGDLVSRYLREGVSVLHGRMAEMIPATKKLITIEVLQGFIPVPNDRAAPTVALPVAAEPQPVPTEGQAA